MIRHFTATAFVTHQNRVLLLWHKSLSRWMPPGGHVDENELPEDAAKRECKEETGLDVEIVGDETPDLFVGNAHEGRMLKKPLAMLLEEIPANEEKQMPAHQHMDFLFHAKLLDPNQVMTLAQEEGTELKWFTKQEIQALDETTEIFRNVKAYILKTLGEK
jgi:ADP-ribose pyrophosphatase YjhB (NUDIX family)